MEKKLTKSNDRVIAGVCGGLAEYFGIDISIVRIGYVIITFASCFTALLLYIAMAIIIPDKNM
ncbi:phage shock protein C (PspC) family protein [Bacteroidales bacterium KHT7]|jgi:phage shock protein PspC (stress-responsive transcriptional regulator)|nr:PspC domain-containing protein [Bacteroidaceae bacterium]SDG65029.1 phage shock protein C (PspC) family protein [Bacteroidales bacterium KHT7]